MHWAPARGRQGPPTSYLADPNESAGETTGRLDKTVLRDGVVTATSIPQPTGQRPVIGLDRSACPRHLLVAHVVPRTVADDVLSPYRRGHHRV